MTSSRRLPPLDELQVQLYRLALERGQCVPDDMARELGRSQDEVGRAVADLMDLHLLRPATDDTCDRPAGRTTYLPSNPDVAAANLTGPINTQIQQLHRQADEVSSRVMSMKTVFEESWQNRVVKSPIEHLVLRDSVQNLLEHLSYTVQKEVVAAYPQLPSPEALAEGKPRTADVINRGVVMRTLYPHSVLAHPYVREHVEEMLELGAQIRTVSTVPNKMIIFDVATAVVSDESEEQGSAAVTFQDPALVRVLYGTWQSIWEVARPVLGPVRELDDTREDLRRNVLRLLASGIKDEVAAKRLSVSVTTYRRHVTSMLTELGAQSRFQAGSYAQRLGWLTQD
ncbi:response regulator transcription factor [Streptomyces sp. NPDC051561]|uniref:response regulator transcription factor n=1 Tax=Streptomyces sp. NPDC051561 TaxID=3365658 RepID=UPI0037B868CD